MTAAASSTTTVTPVPRIDAPLRALAAMLFAATSFAVMNALVGGLHAVPWPLLGLARSVFGLAAALILARARGASLRVFDTRTMWRRSLFGSASMLCTFYALTHMPLADATALLNTIPLWIAALAAWSLRERPSGLLLTALALAFAGVLCIERPSLAVDALPGAMALCAAGLAAIAMVSLRRLSGETPEAVVVHFSAVASAMMALASVAWIATRGAPAPPTVTMVAGVVAIGITATAGQFAITRAYALDRAARVGAAGWIQVVLALAIDAVVFGRRPEGWTVAGIALILAGGVALVTDARRDERPTAGPR